MTPSPAAAGAPAITVILTTCDRPLLLERAVASVLRQSESDWGLLVVDDGASELAWRKPDDHRVSYVKTPGRIGAALARNLGMQRARSDWMVLLDDDDEMEEGFLSHFLKTHVRKVDRPAFALADWRILDYGEDGSITRERRRTYDLGADPCAQNIHQALRAGACGLAVNRLALERSGPMDADYALTEDTEWILRLIGAGCQILYAPGPGFIIHNRGASDQLSSARHFDARIQECRMLKDRYGDLDGRFPGLGEMFDGLIATYLERRSRAGHN